MSTQYDYSNLIKVELLTGIASRAPVDPGVYGFPPEILADLKSVLDPTHPLYNTVWWPEDNQSAPLGEYQRYIDPETLTPDNTRKVVVTSRPIENWTAEEIEADMAPKRPEAIYNANRDTDAFYNTYIGRREWEQAVLEKAKVFAAAGYTGDVPDAVAAMMTEQSLTAQAAADAIIAKFDDMSGVMGQIFAKREKCHAAMRAATVNNELNAAVSEWATFIDGLSASLNISRRYDY